MSRRLTVRKITIVPTSAIPMPAPSIDAIKNRRTNMTAKRGNQIVLRHRVVHSKDQNTDQRYTLKKM